MESLPLQYGDKLPLSLVLVLHGLISADPATGTAEEVAGGKENVEGSARNGEGLPGPGAPLY
jgi:hypothetical protein